MARTRRFALADRGALVREIVTPEGVPLPFEIARGGDRAASFFLDFLIQMGLMVAVLILYALGALGGGAWVAALFYLAWFLIRNGYFLFFELRWQGSTPGKRVNRIRVMDADGGPLRADAIVVRNLMRELELWLPLSLLVTPGLVWPDAPGWARVISCLWAILLAFMPLFNRQRLRLGDMVAGTIVVRAPKAVLLGDLGGQELERREKKRAHHAFTEKQLDVYGIYELQVLEDLLRRGRSRHRTDAMRAVRGRIVRKIRWKGRIDDDERFLREFYAALRARLEKKMLLGKRKEDKFSDA